MNNKDFVVLDLETLGLYDNAVILSAGIAVGKYGENKSIADFINTGYYCEFSIPEQLAIDRTMTKSVVDWWKKQSVEAKLVLDPTRPKIQLTEFPEAFKQFVKLHGLGLKSFDIYDRTSFDIKKIEYLIQEEMKQEVWWNYGNVLELSTALKFLGFDRYGGLKAEQSGIIYHNALHDAALDAYRIQNCINEVFGVTVEDKIPEDNIPF